MVPERMNFGIFMAPFHRTGENPTLCLQRDLELDLVARLASATTRPGSASTTPAAGRPSPRPKSSSASPPSARSNIRLGTGVVSIPYHHPFHVADRMVLLDHLTRGRVMLGVGPGALPSDAQMLGIEPTRQREMMDEGLGVIIRLMTEDEPITYETDWFKLRDAQLQLKPYQRPHMPMAVASTLSPAGMITAGKHGAGVLSVASYAPEGLAALSTAVAVLRRGRRQGRTPGPRPPRLARRHALPPRRLARRGDQGHRGGRPRLEQRILRRHARRAHARAREERPRDGREPASPSAPSSARPTTPSPASRSSSTSPAASAACSASPTTGPTARRPSAASSSSPATSPPASRTPSPGPTAPSGPAQQRELMTGAKTAVFKAITDHSPEAMQAAAQTLQEQMARQQAASAAPGVPRPRLDGGPACSNAGRRWGEGDGGGGGEGRLIAGGHHKRTLAQTGR